MSFGKEQKVGRDWDDNKGPSYYFNEDLINSELFLEQYTRKIQFEPKKGFNWSEYKDQLARLLTEMLENILQLEQSIHYIDIETKKALKGQNQEEVYIRIIDVLKYKLHELFSNTNHLVYKPNFAINTHDYPVQFNFQFYQEQIKNNIIKNSDEMTKYFADSKNSKHDVEFASVCEKIVKLYNFLQIDDKNLQNKLVIKYSAILDSIQNDVFKGYSYFIDVDLDMIKQMIVNADISYVNPYFNTKDKCMKSVHDLLGKPSKNLVLNLESIANIIVHRNRNDIFNRILKTFTDHLPKPPYSYPQKLENYTQQVAEEADQLIKEFLSLQKNSKMLGNITQGNVTPEYIRGLSYERPNVEYCIRIEQFLSVVHDIYQRIHKLSDHIVDFYNKEKFNFEMQIQDSINKSINTLQEAFYQGQLSELVDNVFKCLERVIEKEKNDRTQIVGSGVDALLKNIISQENANRFLTGIANQMIKQATNDQDLKRKQLETDMLRRLTQQQNVKLSLFPEDLQTKLNAPILRVERLFNDNKKLDYESIEKNLKPIYKKFKNQYRLIFYMIEGLSFMLIVGQISYKKLQVNFKKYIWDPREDVMYPDFDPSKITIGAFHKKEFNYKKNTYIKFDKSIGGYDISIKILCSIYLLGNYDPKAGDTSLNASQHSLRNSEVQDELERSTSDIDQDIYAITEPEMLEFLSWGKTIESEIKQERLTANLNDKFLDKGRGNVLADMFGLKAPPPPPPIYAPKGSVQPPPAPPPFGQQPGVFSNIANKAQQQQAAGGVFGKMANQAQQQQIGKAAATQVQQQSAGGMFGKIASYAVGGQPQQNAGGQPQQNAGGVFGKMANQVQQQQVPKQQPSPKGVFDKIADKKQQQQVPQPSLPKQDTKKKPLTTFEEVADEATKKKKKTDQKKKEEEKKEEQMKEDKNKKKKESPKIEKKKDTKPAAGIEKSVTDVVILQLDKLPVIQDYINKLDFYIASYDNEAFNNYDTIINALITPIEQGRFFLYDFQDGDVLLDAVNQYSELEQNDPDNFEPKMEAILQQIAGQLSQIYESFKQQQLAPQTTIFIPFTESDLKLFALELNYVQQKYVYYFTENFSEELEYTIGILDQIVQQVFQAVVGVEGELQLGTYTFSKGTIKTLNSIEYQYIKLMMFIQALIMDPQSSKGGIELTNDHKERTLNTINAYQEISRILSDEPDRLDEHFEGEMKKYNNKRTCALGVKEYGKLVKAKVLVDEVRNLLEDLVESHKTGPINLYYFQNIVNNEPYTHFCYAGPNLSLKKKQPNEISIFSFDIYDEEILKEIRECVFNCCIQGYECKFYTDFPRNTLLLEKPKVALGVWANLINEHKFNAWDAMAIMIYNYSAYMPPQF